MYKILWENCDSRDKTNSKRPIVARPATSASRPSGPSAPTSPCSPTAPGGPAEMDSANGGWWNDTGWTCLNCKYVSDMFVVTHGGLLHSLWIHSFHHPAVKKAFRFLVFIDSWSFKRLLEPSSPWTPSFPSAPSSPAVPFGPQSSMDQQWSAG